MGYMARHKHGWEMAEDRHSYNGWRPGPELKWISLAQGKRREAPHEAGQGH